MMAELEIFELEIPFLAEKASSDAHPPDSCQRLAHDPETIVIYANYCRRLSPSDLLKFALVHKRARR